MSQRKMPMAFLHGKRGRRKTLHLKARCRKGGKLNVRVHSTHKGRTEADMFLV